MLQLLRTQKPELLWIRLAGPCAGAGNKRDSARALHLVAIAQVQQAQQGMVVVEANARSQVWHLQDIQGLILGLSVTKHSWCSYFVDPQKSDATRCNSVLQIASNYPFASAECKCASNAVHRDSKHLGRMKDVVWSKVLYGLVSTVLRNVSQDLLHRQPEFMDTRIGQPTAVAPNPNLHSAIANVSVEGIKLSIPAASHLEQNPQPLSQSISNAKKSVTFVDIDPEFDVQTYPTEQAIRRKAVIAAGHQPAKRNKNVEQHRDDCGESLDSILEIVEVHSWTPALNAYLQDDDEQSSQIYPVLSEFVEGRGRWMHGSGSPGPLKTLRSRATISVRQLSAFHKSIKASEGRCVALLELFGGAGETSHIVAKVHGLKSGMNFDISAGFNLLNTDDVQVLHEYVGQHKPLVVIMAPPCKSFGSLQALNRIINSEAWKASRAVGKVLADLAANVADLQISEARHFLVEQPAASTMFQLPSWRRLFDKHKLFSCEFDQCMVGLRMQEPPYLPVRKPTVFVSSTEVLLRPFYNMRCNGAHQHASITTLSQNQHSVRSREMQVWPSRMCRMLAGAVADCVYEVVAQMSLEGSYVAKQQSYAECPGCKRHRRRDDPEHDRGPNCRYQEFDAHVWNCPACRRNLPRASPKHLLDETCRWTVASSLPPGLSRERKGQHPRDARVPHAADPTAEVRMRDLAPPRDTGARSSADPAPLMRHRPAQPAAAGVQRPTRRDSAAQVDEGGLGAQHDRGVGSDVPMPLPADSTAAVPSASIAESVEPPQPNAGPVPAVAAQDNQSWSRFDVGRALQELRSGQPGVVRRAMRRLHLRWYHAPVARMETLLQAAGLPQSVISLCRQVVDTCQVCRSWSKPTPRAIATSALPARFNQLIQCDLLFIKDKIVLHTIDVCTRFSCAEEVKDRNTDTLLTALQGSWFKHFGPPRSLVVDQEGGLTGPEAGTWLEARGVQLDPKARNQHATMVERHHELLRRQVHLLESHTLNEGLRASFSAILSEAVLAKNILFNVGGVSPYEAVYGRIPPLVTVTSHESSDLIDDRDADRLRHIALQSIMQATAEAKARRASAAKTRMAGEALQLEPGDAVEFWRKASTKDVEAWHGPATVVDTTSVRDGLVSVRWQGRILSCRLQDIRRALVYAVFLGITVVNSPVHVLRTASESHAGVCIRIGWFKQKGVWRACDSNARYAQELLSGLHVAACNLGFHGVVSLRFGSSLVSLSAIDCDESLLIWWIMPKMDEWNHAFMAGSQHVNVGRLCGHDANSVAFLQFFSEDEATIADLRLQVTDVPNLGGIHEPALPRLRDVTAAVNRRARERLAIADVEAQVEPQVFDIATPDGESTQSEASTVEPEEEPFFSFYCSGPPEVCLDAAPEACFVLDAKELRDEPPELLFAANVSSFVSGIRKLPADGEVVSVHLTDEPYSVIERVNNILSRSEALEHSQECRDAMLKELGRWHSHRAWERLPLAKAHNALTSKWVLKWKPIDKVRTIKARLVAQGFKDVQATQNYAATTTRWGQRLVLLLAAQFEWDLVSADVSEAFLRGLTFAELYETGVDPVLREVQLIIPPGAEELIRTLPGFENFSSQNECLKLLKPGFGLKDAPRLWSLALRKVLVKIGLRATRVDAQLYVKHSSGKLVLLVSVHVDDLKLTGIPAEIAEAIKVLEQAFDALKIEKNNFDHLGLRHRLHSDGSRTVDQKHYVEELRPIPEGSLRIKNANDGVDETVSHQFMSLLGGIAWTVQTRMDAAVFVSALQRRLKAPRVQDVLNLNRVLKYLKLKPLELRYRKIPSPWRMIVVSDSAFKGEDQDCLAIRSGIIALTSRAGIAEGMNDLQVVEFVTKKQSKVCRSTYAAELHSCLDLLGTAGTINATMSEILTGAKTAAQLADAHDAGTQSLRMDLAIDAMSVWQSVVGEEARCSDQLCMLHLCKLRECVRSTVDRFIWVDTRSMLADGLTKGVISRQALRDLAEKGSWLIGQALKIFQVKSSEDQGSRQ